MEPYKNNPVMDQQPANEPTIRDDYDEPQPLPMMGFWEAVRTCFNKYYDFTGRARRSEYWWFFLFTMLAILLWMLFGTLLLALPIGMAVQHLSGNESAVVTIMMVIMFLPMLFLLLPSLAVQVRRLHDTGRSGWWVVASIIFQIVASALPFILFGTGALDLGFKEEFTKPFEVSTLAGVSNATFYIASEVLSIILIVFSIFNSHKTENKYGPSPKYQNSSEEEALNNQ